MPEEDNLYGIGGALGGLRDGLPTAEATPANTTDLWKSFLTNPTNQAMLMAAGSQLMAPRWNRASALPDALNAAGTAAAAQKGYEDQQGKEAADAAFQQQALKSREAEGAANRTSSEKNAKTAADSRAEQADIRGQYALDKAQMLGTGRTPFEQKQFLALSSKYTSDAEKAAADAHKSDLKNVSKPFNSTSEQKQKWTEEAAIRADREIRAARAYGQGGAEAPGAPVIPSVSPQGWLGMPRGGNATSVNPAGTGGPVSPPSGSVPPVGTSVNPPAGQGATLNQMKDQFTAREWDEMLKDPRARVELQKRLNPGEMLPGAPRASNRRGTLPKPPAIEE